MDKQTVKNNFRTLEGNEAAAHVAYRTNEICIIYPITPASQMGELPDQWANDGIKNIFGTVPEIVQMQSEGGAAGAIHGAVQGGALATTFTSSQGLLLMIPNMYRIAGELTPAVFHVACRTIAYSGMSIYCDHSDIMATRATGFAMLGSSSVQEAHDMALIAQSATLQSRVPFLHFFDGLRTSHEVSKIEILSDEQIVAMIDNDLVIANRERRLISDNPTTRGLVQDSDTYFQHREAVNPFYNMLPKILENTLERFRDVTGREYKLVEYFGDPQAERVMVIMGSAAETAQETVAYLNKQGEKIGLLKIRLFRPFPQEQFLQALPNTCKAIVVMDRVKESGAVGEPLFEEVSVTLGKKIIGGRYGLASKEFTPAMVKAIFDELKKAVPENHFTIGINDDVTFTSLEYDANFDIEPDSVVRAIFYGLGADGTVGANKNTIKIIGEETDLYAQGYFVYDAKKSGSKTTSYLRFGPDKIHSTYLISRANFIGCHQFSFIEKINILDYVADGAIFLLNCPYPAEKAWDHLPYILQQKIIDKNIKFYVIDALKVARESGMRGRINTVMQTCFFALSGVLPRDAAIEKIKGAIKKSYANKGEEVIQKNFAAVDNTLANLFQVTIPGKATSTIELKPAVTRESPKFVQEVIGKMLAGYGNELPVSAFPVDGTYDGATTQWEKRNIAHEVPCWNSDACAQCGMCSLVCPHSAIRVKRDKEYALQIYSEDCTGCGACVEICPINRGKSGKKALVMGPKPDDAVVFEKTPRSATNVTATTVRDLQYVDPLFEFCSACAGCGEAPYIKILSQLYGDRLMIADACGCTLVYGGSLPTSPWAVNAEGRGPAFSASLFEDNAEFGYGIMLAVEKHQEQALELLEALASEIKDAELIKAIQTSNQNNEPEISAQRERVTKLKVILQDSANPQAKSLISLADHLVKHSVWAIGGDGWAYDIGYGGLDHVLASGRNIKVLVLDTEAYSNTGGQASKASPRGAVVKFAAQGKQTAKKDLGLMMMTYGNIYVASIALGANPNQAIKAFHEAENYNGPSLILAYSHCIAHGIEMHKGMQQQQLAVKCGYWPLYRYNPDRAEQGLNPLQIDSEEPSVAFSEYAKNENRYQILARDNPAEAERLMKLAEEDMKRRWRLYNALKG